MRIFIPKEILDKCSKDEIEDLLVNVDKLEYIKDVLWYKQRYILIKGEPKTLVRKII